MLNKKDAKYILKLDDDVFVHVGALLKFLKQELSQRDVKRLILCDSITTLKVRRSWRSKWRVLPKEYPNKEYPTYCAGWAILYTVDTVFLLYREAQKEPYFWIDDVHVTGTLAKKINLTHISVNSMILSEYMMAILLKRQRIKKDFIFGPPNLMETGIRALHNAVTTNIII
ncbi:PREDICTED: beta-1,3-galactosyltransferase 1-like [Ceratosolen solmsi marchali]|uniref:Hexosyltransferase n=1 Tax=Ceratosolen solmsi marchali TaxID=326594 RepID=A0AAJ7DTS4_9HYME|nr:PREDICTED: beta-1,3-galactosyltransferase 1-like [Ceratosolen solmsi marchali]